MFTVKSILELFILSFFSPFIFADELHQQVTVNTLQPPTPFKAHNHVFLVYEDMLTNFEKSPITLTSVQINQFPYNNSVLESMVHNIASRLQLGDNKYHLIFKSPSDDEGRKIVIRIGSNK